MSDDKFPGSYKGRKVSNRRKTVYKSRTDGLLVRRKVRNPYRSITGMCMHCNRPIYWSQRAEAREGGLVHQWHK